jgi:hypothetical protein
MTGQDQLPWDPAYVAACDAVIAAHRALREARDTWETAVRRRNRYLTADGVLPHEAT